MWPSRLPSRAASWKWYKELFMCSAGVCCVTGPTAQDVSQFLSLCDATEMLTQVWHSSCLFNGAASESLSALWAWFSSSAFFTSLDCSFISGYKSNCREMGICSLRNLRVSLVCNAVCLFRFVCLQRTQDQPFARQSHARWAYRSFVLRNMCISKIFPYKINSLVIATFILNPFWKWCLQRQPMKYSGDDQYCPTCVRSL